MSTRELWVHKKSGEVYAVEHTGELINGACGPLNPDERGQNLDDYDYDNTQDDAEWIEENSDDFDLYEE